MKALGGLGVLAGVSLIAFLLLEVNGIRTQLSAIDRRLETASDAETGRDQLVDAPAAADFHKPEEALQAIKALGEEPPTEDFARALATIDAWLVDDKDEASFTKLKLEQLSRLRKKVKSEVESLQQEALKSITYADGTTKHSKAGRVLSLYPVSDDKSVIEEAKQLSARQGDVAVRLEEVRRQRYNQWATGQIEAAINVYNENVSKNPLANNSQLIDPLIEQLGPVDPGVLEPVVLELYNYALDRTKGSLSEASKIDLAKRLTDPSIQRKPLGEF
jgi:hypothetical protein